MLNNAMNISKRMYALCLLFILLTTVVYMTGCGRSEGKGQSENDRFTTQAIKVSVVTIEPTLIRDVIVLPGETEAWQDVRLAADKDGQVEWIGPHEGQEVKKGRLIAKIDDSALKAALDHADASFNLAEMI